MGMFKWLACSPSNRQSEFESHWSLQLFCKFVFEKNKNKQKSGQGSPVCIKTFGITLLGTWATGCLSAAQCWSICQCFMSVDFEYSPLCFIIYFSPNSLLSYFSFFWLHSLLFPLSSVFSPSQLCFKARNFNTNLNHWFRVWLSNICLRNYHLSSWFYLRVMFFNIC